MSNAEKLADFEQARLVAIINSLATELGEWMTSEGVSTGMGVHTFDPDELIGNAITATDG